MYFIIEGGDAGVQELLAMGQIKQTAVRICKELPGHNWLEEKIRKSKTTGDSPNKSPQSLNSNEDFSTAQSSLPVNHPA